MDLLLRMAMADIYDALLEMIRQLPWYLAICTGIFLISKKAGLEKPWFSYIPVVRYLRLGRLAGREKESRVFIGLNLILRFILISMSLIHIDGEQTDAGGAGTETDAVAADAVTTLENDPDLRLALLLVVAFLAVSFALVIYNIRIYNGLCEHMHKSKLWSVPAIILEPVVLLYFGISKKISYDAMEEKTGVGAGVSGAEATVLSRGLTVDITERTAGSGRKQVRLLRDIHLSIPRGHMVLLLGGSGAGKTTFLNAVTGYEPADATILLDGKDIYRDYEQMKYDIGFVPQQDLMRGNDTVLRTLSDSATLRLPDNMGRKGRKQRVAEVLESFGLSMLGNTLVEKLSGGQRKRLSIAMEFISDPGLFILDEPDSGLDGVVARSLFEKLRAIADEGRIVIVITHTPDRVIDLFDDVIVLAKDVDRTGRLAYYGPVEEAKKFFGKDGMEGILLTINQKEEGGEGRANEFVEKYAKQLGKEVARS